MVDIVKSIIKDKVIGSNNETIARMVHKIRIFISCLVIFAYFSTKENLLTPYDLKKIIKILEPFKVFYNIHIFLIYLIISIVWMILSIIVEKYKENKIEEEQIKISCVSGVIGDLCTITCLIIQTLFSLYIIYLLLMYQEIYLRGWFFIIASFFFIFYVIIYKSYKDHYASEIKDKKRVESLPNEGIRISKQVEN